MTVIDPQEEARIRELFYRAAFIRELGIELDALGPGWCETSVPVQPVHLQQDGFVHAGVLSSLADHTGGGAGWTVTAPGQTVLSVEFKISLLRPAKTDQLTCRAEVLRAGRTLVFTESVVRADGRPVAKLSQTLAIVDGSVGKASIPQSSPRKG